MAYQRSNGGEQEWRGTVDQYQMDVLIHIRGSPSQLRDLFQGSPGDHYATPRSIRGQNCSICEPDYSSNSGVQLREQDSTGRDAKIRNARKKNSCGGCCIIFYPLVKIVEVLSLVLNCCF